MADEQTADFFNPAPADAPPAAPVDDAPILLGSPDEGAPDFAAAPADAGGDFIGDVDATGAASGDAEPIILMGAPPEAPAQEGEGAMGFAAAPAEGGDDMMGFAAAPAAEPESSGAVVIEDVDDDEAEAAEAEAAQPEELSPMAKWNNEWQVTLMQRKDEENAKKAEHVEQSRLDMEKFQAEREARREAKMARNRAEEQDKLEAIEADLENDNSWQRVCKLVEMSHDSDEQAADVSRMRDVMILLKNEPTRATVLA